MGDKSEFQPIAQLNDNMAKALAPQGALCVTFEHLGVWFVVHDWLR